MLKHNILLNKKYGKTFIKIIRLEMCSGRRDIIYSLLAGRFLVASLGSRDKLASSII